MRYGMVIDLKKCIGCYGCQIFCKAENATPPGMLWSRVLFYESGNYPSRQEDTPTRALYALPASVVCRRVPYRGQYQKVRRNCNRR